MRHFGPVADLNRVRNRAQGDQSRDRATVGPSQARIRHDVELLSDADGIPGDASDNVDGDASDADGTDADGTDADGTDADGTDADGTDGDATDRVDGDATDADGTDS